MFGHIQHPERTIFRTVLTPLACLVLVTLTGASHLQALTLTGTVTTAKILVTNQPANVSTNAVLKILLETTTSGEYLELCSGTLVQYESGLCGAQLSTSKGSEFMFMAIVDAASLNGKYLYILRPTGNVPISFRVTVE